MATAQFTSVAHATVTETAILRGRVDELESDMTKALDAIEDLQEQNELLRRQVAALKDGAWLRNDE